MELRIHEAPECFFNNNKEEYFKFKKSFANFVNNKELCDKLTAFHFFIYGLICGRDITKAFKLKTNFVKLDNGQTINNGIYYARKDLSSLLNAYQYLSSKNGSIPQKYCFEWNGRINWWYPTDIIQQGCLPFFELGDRFKSIIQHLDEELPPFKLLENVHYYFKMPRKITYDSIWNIKHIDNYRKKNGFYVPGWEYLD